MTQVVRPLLTALAVAGAGVLSACSTTTTAQGSAAEVHTGTHLQQPSTYQMVRRTDAAGSREMMRNLPPNPGPRTQ